MLVWISISCEYREYADAEYIGQKIYMPAANYNVYEIREESKKPSVHPTEGNRSRYKIDETDDRFIIPLGVYRSGIDRRGSFDVDIEINNDTISDLMTLGTLDSNVLILPDEQFSLPEQISLADGDNFSGFDLEIDLKFLQEMNANSPDIKYAVGVEISSEARPVTKELKTTMILIDTDVAVP